MARVLLLGLILTVLSACGGDGEGSAADEGPGTPYRVLEGSFLMFSPDPPSPAAVITEPASGTFRLERASIRAFGFYMTGLHLRAGTRFTIEGVDDNKALLVGQEVDPGFQGSLGGEVPVLINGDPVQLSGGGPYCPLDASRVTLSGLELCAPSVDGRCDDIRNGTRAGFFLRIVAVPER